MHTALPTGKDLQREHEQLSARFTDLCDRAACGEWSVVDEVWSSFAGDLERHLRLEEEALFPPFAAESERNRNLVKKLKAAHVEIRRQLEAMGIDVQLKALRSERVNHFIHALRAHAAHEDLRFHPWLDAHGPAEARA